MIYTKCSWQKRDISQIINSIDREYSGFILFDNVYDTIMKLCRRIITITARSLNDEFLCSTQYHRTA